MERSFLLNNCLLSNHYLITQKLDSQFMLQKGPVKLMKRVKIAHSFLQSVKSVPHYHFKLAYVILQMAVKEFFETHFYKWRYRPF